MSGRRILLFHIFEYSNVSMLAAAPVIQVLTTLYDIYCRPADFAGA